MSWAERVIEIACRGKCLPGVLAAPASPGDLAVLIIVGGPQYRVGSHRQFVLLARALAAQGYPALRFDVRGMGDAGGGLRGFEDLDDDIAAAIDALAEAVPGLHGVVLWGLCDGASAALLYWGATHDPRVVGMALANPWVRSTTTYARAQVKHYYLNRVTQRDFWVKLLRGGIGVGALAELAGSARQALGRGDHDREPAAAAKSPFQRRMADAWRAFPGALLLLLSGRDLTAQEFLEAVGADPAWAGLLGRAGSTRHDLPQSDHTFSDGAARREVERLTQQWLSTVEHSPDRPLRSSPSMAAALKDQE